MVTYLEMKDKQDVSDINQQQVEQHLLDEFQLIISIDKDGNRLICDAKTKVIWLPDNGKLYKVEEEDA